jgi:hypothetical protein
MWYLLHSFLRKDNFQEKKNNEISSANVNSGTSLEAESQ